MAYKTCLRLTVVTVRAVFISVPLGNLKRRSVGQEISLLVILLELPSLKVPNYVANSPDCKNYGINENCGDRRRRCSH